MRMGDVGAVVQWDVAGYIGPWNRMVGRLGQLSRISIRHPYGTDLHFIRGHANGK